jgi:phosphohistidine phosphatase
MRLLIMRHGKSDWDGPSSSDHDRQLAGRGIKAARAMGAALSLAGQAPDLVHTSSAVRAQRTAEIAHRSGEWTAPIKVHDDLYGCSPDTALDVVRTTPDTIERVMVVGHEPTWSMLTHQLTGGRVQVKTATVVAVDMPGISWSSLSGTGGTIAYVLQPRMLSGWIDAS